MSTTRDVLTAAYKAFNERDIERALATMHSDVDWPNGMEGGCLHGQEAVRDYWTRQWGLIDPHVEPQRFSTDDTGRTVVDVHQVVRDREGRVLTDQMVQHIYVIQEDRKSTRLNSSHSQISYAVFCLKKKKKG